MPAGRPTTYGPEIVEQAREYLENYSEEHGDAIPSVEGLARAIDRARSTIYFWAEDETKVELLDILEEINEEQKRVLINKGLLNEFNSNITKLALGKHGFADKVEQTGDFNVNIPDEDAGTL